MRNKTILCLLLLLFSFQVNAQQRKRTTVQRRVTTTSVKKPVQPTITKTRQVGKDGFVWYELKKGKLYGAADINGKEIIPIKCNWLIYREDGPGFLVYSTDSHVGKGLYTRTGRCVIPENLGLEYVSVYTECGKSYSFKYILGEILINGTSGKKIAALYDMNGKEVIPLDYYESLHITTNLTEIPYIECEQNGLKGAFDLNGNVLSPPRANCFIQVFKDKIEIVNQKDDEFEHDYIYGSYSASTRYNFKSIDYWPMSSSSSSGSSSSSSSSSSSGSGHQQRQVWKERWRNCTACDPDRKGYCRNCHGRGGFYIGNIYNVCGICGGTGSCTMCGGRGEYKETYSTWE